MNNSKSILPFFAFLLVLTGCQKKLSPYDYTIEELNYGEDADKILFLPWAINDEATIVGRGFHTTDYVSLVYQQNLFVELPGLENQIFSGYDINEAGAFVGNYMDPGHAFLYDNGTLINLEDHVNTTELSYSVALGLNNHDDFVGYLANGMLDSTAFVFENQSFTYINICSSAQSRTEAFDINDNGTIVGLCADQSVEHVNTFVRYQGEFSLLEVEGHESMVSADLNEHDVIAGTYKTLENKFHGFTYNLQTEEFLDIGYVGSMAYMDINNQGTIIVVGETENFIYKPHTGLKKMADIVDLSGWNSIREIVGLNEKGQIVGYGTNAAGKNRGFILQPIK